MFLLAKIFFCHEKLFSLNPFIKSEIKLYDKLFEYFSCSYKKRIYERHRKSFIIRDVDISRNVLFYFIMFPNLE